MNYPKEYLDLLAAIDADYMTDALIDFESLEDGTPTKNFTTFVYQSVRNPGNLVELGPFELFLIRNPDVNAFAYRHGDLSLIGIHHSLYKVFEQRLKSRIPSASDYTTGIFNSVEKYLDVEIDFFMFQIMMLFVYYHELAHLYQFEIAKGNQHSAFEKYNLATGKNFKQEIHAEEIDADMFAANNVAFHILQYWQNFPEDARNAATLATLITITMTAILLLFFELGQQWHEIYFFEYDHPHELIRAAYIVELMINSLSNNLKANEPKINYKKCIQISLNIVEELTIAEGVKRPEFMQVFFAYNKEIKAYLDEMKQFLNKVPYLVMHLQKGNVSAV